MEVSKELARIDNTCKAVDYRRKLAYNNELINKLNPVDRDIYIASVKTTIAELNDQELILKLSAVVDIIIRDIGLKKVDTYDVTRFSEVIKTYYSYLTLSEIRLAFELSMTGNLDDYLPRDKYGYPDNNHYQSFSTSYVTKILNAYVKRKADAEYNLYNKIPVQTEISKNRKEYFLKTSNEKLYVEFIRYKYKGIINWDNINGYVVYTKLKSIGYDMPIIVTQKDKEQAVKVLLRKGQDGVINKFVTDCVRILQTKHNDVPGEAIIIARRRAIEQSFDEIINDDVQLIDFLK